jgi:hypothetical protein
VVACVRLDSVEGWPSRSFNRKSKKGTKDKKDPEGIVVSARWTGLRRPTGFLKSLNRKNMKSMKDMKNCNCY